MFCYPKRRRRELYNWKNKEDIKNVLIGGKIGHATAKSLAENKFNVILVEQNKTKALSWPNNYPMLWSFMAMVEMLNF